jgi:hypothetical protein
MDSNIVPLYGYMRVFFNGLLGGRGTVLQNLSPVPSGK